MFTKKHADINIRDARKYQISASDAWDIIVKYEKILIGKGKKIVEYLPDNANKDAILKDALGRSGNLRAPSVIIDGTLLVGYNDELYNGLIDEADQA